MLKGSAQKVLKFYVDSAKTAARDLIHNWPLLLATAVSYIIWAEAGALLGGMGMTGGFVLGILQIVLLTYFYSWISDTLDRNRLKFADLSTFDAEMFSNLISVAFILFLVQYLFSTCIQGLGVDYLADFLNLGIVFVFNVIPEVVVIHRSQSFPALISAFEFTRDKLIPWFTPLLVILAPWILIAPDTLIKVISRSDVMLPALTIFKLTSAIIPIGNLGMAASGGFLSWLAPAEIIRMGIGLIVAIWFTLFRMHLFKRL